MSKAIIYCRFSPRPNADQCESNKLQAERCYRHAAARGLEVLEVYEDRDISGAALYRPRLQAALDTLQPGMVLVVDSNDRLARDMIVALTIHAEVEKRNCTIEFADGSPLRATAEGKLFSNILSAFAQYDRERFAARTRAGMARKKADGVWCGRPPIGWRKVKGEKRLVVDESEQREIAEIRHRSHCGQTSKEIASYLNCNAMCRGRLWSDRTIRRILARPANFPS